MKTSRFLITGILFGIILTKTQVISWFRIYEMFRFESFHMYGIIGSAVVLGVIITRMIHRGQMKDINDKNIVIPDKERSFIRYVMGGILFGLGWALVGACPGPLFALLGAGYWTIILVILGSILGTFLYGVIRNKLPH